MVTSKEADNHMGLSLPQRKSPRLHNFDYGTPGAYFITICAHERRCLFGAVKDGELRLNDAGTMICKWWQKLSTKFDIEIDCFVSMPNHLHGIVLIPSVGTTPRGCPPVGSPRQPRANNELLFQAMGWFKTMTTNEYIRGVNERAWTRFNDHLWQPRYHDHVIRDDEKLNTIRNYIETNPQRWIIDCFHPDNTSEW